MIGILAVVSVVRSSTLDGGRGISNNGQGYVNEGTRSTLTKMDRTKKVWTSRQLGIAPRTRTIKISHWSYWRRFCGVWGLYTSHIGALGANSEETMILRLHNDLYVLSAFSGFIVFAPLSLYSNRTTNTVNYTDQVISSVRGHYASIHGRRPGLIDAALGETSALYPYGEAQISTKPLQREKYDT